MSWKVAIVPLLLAALEALSWGGEGGRVVIVSIVNLECFLGLLWNHSKLVLLRLILWAHWFWHEVMLFNIKRLVYLATSHPQGLVLTARPLVLAALKDLAWVVLAAEVPLSKDALHELLLLDVLIDLDQLLDLLHMPHFLLNEVQFALKHARVASSTEVWTYPSCLWLIVRIVQHWRVPVWARANSCHSSHQPVGLVAKVLR